LELLLQVFNDNIGGLASYMNGFLSEYRNPSFYNYNLDGDATFISDGGLDMYDGGNFTTPWLIAGTNYTGNAGTTASYPSRVSYANTTATLVDTSFRYASVSGYVSVGNNPSIDGRWNKNWNWKYQSVGKRVETLVPMVGELLLLVLFITELL